MKILHDKDLPADMKAEYESLVRNDAADTAPVEHTRATNEESAQLNLAIHGFATAKAISLKMPGELLEDLKRRASGGLDMRSGVV